MSKYHARRTEMDGIMFDSAAEARRYGELRLMERAGLVTGLELQPCYPITVNGTRVGLYRADFRYQDSNGQQVIEDVKGVRTPVYRLKKKLVEALYDIEITEVRND